MNDDALAALLSPVFGMTPEQLQTAPGRYVAFHQDGAFGQAYGVDWDGFVLRSRQPMAMPWARFDFQLEHSALVFEGLEASTTTDISLRALLESQNGVLFGNQVRELLAEGRMSKEQCNALVFFGCLHWGGSLLEAARAVLLLRDGDVVFDPSVSEYAETDPVWAERLAGLDAATAGHLGLFFQEPNAARCSGGAALDAEPDMDMALPQLLQDLVPDAEVLATWWLGEGQGASAIARIGDGWTPPVPAFEGHALLRKEPVERTRIDLDFLDTPPADVFREAARKDSNLAYFVKQMDGGQSLASLLQTFKDKGQFLPLLGIAGQLAAKGACREAWVMLEALLPMAEGGDICFVHANRAVALSQMRQFAEALEASRQARLAWETEPSTHVPEWMLHKNEAYCARAAGEAETASAAMARALEVGADQPLVQAEHGAHCLIAGDLEGARNAWDRCMSVGVDPNLEPALTAHPLYRELALTHGIPVEWLPDERP